MVISLLKAAICRGPHHLALLVRHPVQHSRYLWRTLKSYSRNYVLNRAGVAECDMSSLTVSVPRVVWLAVRRTILLVLWHVWFLILFFLFLLGDFVRRRL